jgi:hypothetical protein
MSFRSSERPKAATSLDLRLDAISLSFGGIKALSDINLAIAPGEIRATCQLLWRPAHCPGYARKLFIQLL